MKTSGLLFVGLLAIFIFGQSVLQSSRNESLIAASVRAESVRAEQPVQPQVISSSNLESRVAELENRLASTQQNSGSRVAVERFQKPSLLTAARMNYPAISSSVNRSQLSLLNQIDEWRQGRWGNGLSPVPMPRLASQTQQTSMGLSADGSARAGQLAVGSMTSRRAIRSQ